MKYKIRNPSLLQKFCLPVTYCAAPPNVADNCFYPRPDSSAGLFLESFCQILFYVFTEVTDIKLAMVFLSILSQKVTIFLGSIEGSKMQFQQNCYRVVVENALTHLSVLALIPYLLMLHPSQCGNHGNKLSTVFERPQFYAYCIFIITWGSHLPYPEKFLSSRSCAS